MNTKAIKPIHPGEHLAEFIEEFGITPYRVAKDTHVSPTRIGEIINSVRAITPDTALRLGRYFGTTGDFWMNLQTHYEMEIALAKKGKQIEKDVVPLMAAG